MGEDEKRVVDNSACIGSLMDQTSKMVRLMNRVLGEVNELQDRALMLEQDVGYIDRKLNGLCAKVGRIENNIKMRDMVLIPRIVESNNPHLNKTLKEIGISEKVEWKLRRGKINSVEQLITMSEAEVFKTRGIGRLSLEIIESSLTKLGLRLGSTIVKEVQADERAEIPQ